MEELTAVEAFAKSLGEWTPTIPDEVVAHFLSRAGFQTPDVRVKRLVALAAQKFVSDVASDAMEYYANRQPGAAKKLSSQQQMQLQQQQQSSGGAATATTSSSATTAAAPPGSVTSPSASAAASGGGLGGPGGAGSGGGAEGTRRTKNALMMEDLSLALREMGVTVIKPECAEVDWVRIVTTTL
ncbi:transcription initiation factor TFIID subunit 10 [Pelomyxa schiedti]|nr:transcription initiation factor TFIID subunit 10 [Pelomyxa schiedti]